MSRYRQTPRDPLPVGTAVDISRAASRRKLIGKRIAWHKPGWRSVYSGVVQECSGRNMLIDGNWEWAPHMANVVIVDEAAK